MRFFWKLYLRLGGWKVKGQFPYHLKKMVLVVAPHTSWVDFVVGVAFRSELKIEQAKFLGKAELFKGPFGFLFRWMGGTPVDRVSKHNMVDQVVERFNSNDSFLLALSPEGTRKRVEKLRTGFYYIAKKAAVPILMIGLDFENRQLVIGEAFTTTDDEAADFKKILDFFALIKGKKPANGLKHLVQPN
jgi:1-acyl-sn-glycerol-3-phosphate acyltransferase